MDIKDVTQARINNTQIQKMDKKTIVSNKNISNNFDSILKRKLNSGKFQNDILNTSIKEMSTAETKSLTFSKHAKERLINRNIDISEEFIGNIEDALKKASSKGIKNALMISEDSAFIVNVDSKTVITAMNIDEMRNNIITNIDGTVII